MNARLSGLASQGVELDLSPASFGPLRDSTDVRGDAEALRGRMALDGYLYLPGLLDRALVLEARKSVTDRLAKEGLTDPDRPPGDAVARPDSGLRFKPDLAHDNEPLHRLLYSGRMMEFFGRFLGGPVRHYDFTWMRAVAPGLGTHPHGDVVFMGRGTHDLYTAWTPLGDVDYVLGGLMVLEGSHRLQSLREGYLTRDVDTYCQNVEGEEEHARHNSNLYGWRWDGRISSDPADLRERLGGRWLTAEYRAGDLLVFSAYTIHASLDNRSDRIRLSSDSRYQLASEPIDERWIGEAPVGHGPAGKRGRIC
ncbi:phytanoyl-CoA dioxygenase [Rubrobacter tropicus]|uniref:Phytanoyl-CoA dioxygenase n=1 Tax=Rubrobacter tropicus TaxID=2653851 RepID=A0A6G8QG25_9ACTN|nr:phytanoyl-CoA dioxygenase [Rubrobacter tropicus]